MVIDNVSLTLIDPDPLDFQGNEITNGGFEAFLPNNSVSGTSQVNGWVGNASKIVNGSTFNEGKMQTFIAFLRNNGTNYNLTQNITLHMPDCLVPSCLKCNNTNKYICRSCLSPFVLVSGKCLSLQSQA